MQKINYNKNDMNNYLNNLQLVGAISALFSDSNTPILYYRATENLYCSSFSAENLSRADVSVDAKLGTIGIGIKTFLENNKKTYQKVAEFNNQQVLYNKLTTRKKILKIAELRNKRLKFAMDAYGMDQIIYHCIIRNEDGFNLYEENMDLIDIENINITNVSISSIDFTDNKNNYKFNISKSTLFKQFVIDDYFQSIKVVVANDPLALINKPVETGVIEEEREILILPLYSFNKKGRFVPMRSGINQWNARGRKRNVNEVYIPFPASIRHKFADFFPSKEIPFNVKLPTGEVISMKICQQNDKAIMSNPNKALGEWLLREVLKVKEKKIITYEMLLELGIDSISFEKNQEGYKLDFKELGSFEQFLESNI